MNVYELTSKFIKKCNNCRIDIDKFNKSYMFVFAQNKNNSNMIYLCGECKDKLKDILNSEV